MSVGQAAGRDSAGGYEPYSWASAADLLPFHDDFSTSFAPTCVYRWEIPFSACSIFH